ncbi:MAG: transposase [Thermodesulfobacteriota bacterium]|nr:transposase [Thermodesulfobacteriota bacterium]
MFYVSATVDTKTLEQTFRYKVLKMLLVKGKITQDMIALLDKWRHSGFNVFCGTRIQPGDEDTMENLARCIIRASFSQERMTYINKILKHPGCGILKQNHRQGKKVTGITEATMDHSLSQIPSWEEHLYFDVEYPFDNHDVNGEAASWEF